ncbi:tetratricopeptide repeat protein [bacterium]|nr:tetratricopeptide repeat protein [bacterium]
MLPFANAVRVKRRSQATCQAALLLLFASIIILSSVLSFGAEEATQDEKTQKERLAECKELFAGANYILSLECCFEVVAMATETDEGIEALYAAGVCYFRLGKYEKALPIFETIVEQYPRSPSFANATNMAEQTRKKMDELGIKPKPKEEMPPEEKEKPKAIGAIHGPSGAAIELHGITVSNVFSNTPLAEALGEIRQETGIRFIIDPSVGGATSLEFEETPLDEALEAMLSPYGFVYKAEENLVVVGTPNPESPLFPRLAMTKIYRPRNLDASEIPALMPKFYGQFIATNNEKNILVVSAPKSVLVDALTRINELDVPQKQVMIELLVVEIKMVKGMTLGVDWSISGDKEYHGEDTGQAATLRSLGVDWTTLLGNIAYTSSADDIKAIGAKLGYLMERGKATVRANPRVTALDNSTAEIYIGTEGYYRILTGSEVYQTTRLEAIKSGVTLRVRPKISGVDMIKLDVAPEVSDVTGRGTEDLPEIAKRSVSTTLKVRDGQTIVMGGLYQKRKSRNITKVPILGHIPLVGMLFTKKSTEFVETEVVIFITPHILLDDAELTSAEQDKLEEKKDKVGSKVFRFLFNE